MPTRSDRDALLAAVVEAPDDDTPRLVYADWLEETGGTAGAARAEFIRTQVELARLPPGGPQRKKLQQRESALLKAHGTAWRSELPAWARSAVLFRRGFADHIVCTARDFLKGARALFRQAPVQGAGLRNAAGLGRELAACPELARLRELRVVDSALGDEGARALAGSPHVAGLVLLDLGYNGLGPAAAQALAAGDHWAKLRELLLNGNRLGSPGASALAASKRLAGLVRLELAGNGIGDAGALALANSSHLRALAELDLSDQEGGPHAFLGNTARTALRERYGDGVKL